MDSLEKSSLYPNIESDCSAVGVEYQRMDFDTESSNVLLLELAGHMALYERSLSGTTITDKDTLECGDIAFSCHFR